MGCRSDYMEPNEIEKEAGRVKMLLEELKTGTPVDPEDYASAYIYNQSQAQLDDATNQLCSQLQGIGNLSSHSLELQMWWRDHQLADARRLKEEIQQHKDEADRKAAIAKLTPHERSLLNLN